MPTSSKFTTARMKKVSKRLNGIYKQASEELAEKVNSFFADFERLDKQKVKLVESGKMSEREYKEWRKNKLLMGKKYEDLRDTMVERMTKADEIATAYMNGELPAVYAHNFNQVGKDAEAIVKGYSFDLVNEDAVRKLSTSDKTLLPYKIVDGRRTERWHTKRVNSAILQGILQGEGSKKIAQRLMETAEMGKVSAMRNARTALTGAQNKGREDAMGRLAKAGLPIRKKWMASTGDGRTRPAHLELHEVSVPWDKPFENAIGRIMYPGDPNAHPSNVYNCRCSLVTDFSELLQEEEEEEEYTGEVYYHPIDSLEGATSEEMEVLNNRFSQLDKIYHAKVDSITTTLERDQKEYDLFFENRVKYEMEQNPKMRRSTAEKRVLEIMGPRPSADPNAPGWYERITKGGDFNLEDRTMTINTLSVFQNGGIDGDIEHRKKAFERNERRIKEGRTPRTFSNVGISFESVFIHEYGHAIDAEYVVSEHPLFVKFYSGLTDAEKISVSDYATTNKQEFIAEAFCESFMGDTQGEVSKRFMKVLEEIIHDKH